MKDGELIKRTKEIKELAEKGDYRYLFLLETLAMEVDSRKKVLHGKGLEWELLKSSIEKVARNTAKGRLNDIKTFLAEVVRVQREKSRANDTENATFIVGFKNMSSGVIPVEVVLRKIGISINKVSHSHFKKVFFRRTPLLINKVPATLLQQRYTAIFENTAENYYILKIRAENQAHAIDLVNQLIEIVNTMIIRKFPDYRYLLEGSRVAPFVPDGEVIYRSSVTKEMLLLPYRIQDAPTGRMGYHLEALSDTERRELQVLLSTPQSEVDALLQEVYSAFCRFYFGKSLTERFLAGCSVLDYFTDGCPDAYILLCRDDIDVRTYKNIRKVRNGIAHNAHRFEMPEAYFEPLFVYCKRAVRLQWLLRTNGISTLKERANALNILTSAAQIKGNAAKVLKSYERFESIEGAGISSEWV